MLKKHFVFIYLALLIGSGHLAHAADESYKGISNYQAQDVEDLLEFGFVLVPQIDEELIKEDAEKTVAEGCNILIDNKFLPKAEKLVKPKTAIKFASFSKRSESATKKNLPLNPLMKQSLLDALQVELAQGLPHAIILDIATASAKLDKLIVNVLPTPKILNDGEGGLIRILWRGCRPDQLAKNLVYGSAGGEPANKDAPKPSEKQAQLQVSELISLPEFTSNPGISRSFGTNNFMVAFKINNKYLAQGSGTEQGLVCANNAPVEVIGIVSGRNL